MRFADLLDSLPNGLHDAQLRRFEMDYVRKELTFDLDVWIGDMNARVRELYRPARLTLENVAFLVIEPPHPDYPWDEPGEIRIDAGVGQPTQSSSKLPDAPDGASVAWMYLEDLNTFLVFATASASLDWTGPEYARG